MERCNGCMKLKKSHPVCEHCGYDERTKNQEHQLPVGTVLHGQYQVGKVLGQGGFGITYLGWDRTLQMPVAIKELFPMGMVSRNCNYSCKVTNTDGGKWKDQVRDIRNRFLQEARTLAQLSNVSEIVNIRYFFEENNTAYIIMEYLQGTDLRRYVKQKGGCLSAQETLSIMKPVIRALSVVHEHSLIHRDISPDNIMMMDDGKIKILDFGAAKSVTNPDQNNPLSQSTQAILKHGFAPIEQYQSRGSLGPWTDVHALCATIFFCLTGNVPPDAPRRIVEGIHLDWSRFPDLTDRQRSVLGAGMAIRAQDRTASMEALYAELYRSEQQKIIPDTPRIAKTCPVCMQELGQSGVCGRCGHDARFSNKTWQLPAGTFLSRRYGVGRVLAEGTCDITYKGWDLSRNRPVAIREFFVRGMVDRDSQSNLRLMDVEPAWQEFVRRAYDNFYTSTRNLTTIGTGAQFPSVYEVLNEKGTAYQIMEFVPGKTLARYVRERGGKLDPARALALMEPVIRGMGNAHRSGEIHRDLNPNNIKVTEDGKAWILDFCIVPELRTPWEIRQGMKQQPSPFHPYELYTDRYPLNPATDVYAVCAILYWCMTGQLPPDGPRRVRDHVNPQWWLIPGLTPQQRNTLDKGMAVQNGSRIANMEELYNGLFLGDGDMPTIPAGNNGWSWRT